MRILQNFCFFALGISAISLARELDFPDEKHAIDMIEESIVNLYSENGKIFATPFKKNRLISVKLNAEGLPIYKPIPDYGLQKRIEDYKVGKKERFHLISTHTGGYILFDSYELKVRLVSRDFKTIRTSDLIWDLLKPAADSRGEPTNVEIGELRRKFVRAFIDVDYERFSGMIPIGNPANHTYLLTTRIKGFPFVQMSCGKGNRMNCRLTRACFTEGFRIDAEAAYGLGMHQKRRRLVVADRKQNLVHVLRYKNCYHIKHLRTISFDPKIKAIGATTVDLKGRLWLSVLKKDDYHNASLYVWDQNAWID